MFIVVYSNWKERNSLGLPGSRYQEGIKYVRHTYLFPLHEENRQDTWRIIRLWCKWTWVKEREKGGWKHTRLPGLLRKVWQSLGGSLRQSWSTEEPYFSQDRVFLSTPAVVAIGCKQPKEGVASKCRTDFWAQLLWNHCSLMPSVFGGLSSTFSQLSHEVNWRVSHMLALKILQLFSTSLCLKINNNSN